MCAAYIPPENSSYWRSQQFDPYAILETDIQLYQSSGNIILTGDFNARTGSLHDHLSDFSFGDEIEDITRGKDNILLDQLNRTERNNLDSTVNSYGKSLISLCKSFNLRLLNGRTPGDSTGNFTCFQYNGYSTVDYIVCDENLLPIIPFIEISPPTHLSDHSHISCYVNCSIVTNSRIPTESNNTAKKEFKWGQDSNAVFASALKLPIFQSKLHHLQTKELNVDDYWSELSNIIINVAKFSLKMKRRGKIKHHSKLGFDLECKRLKSHVLNLGKMVAKFPKDPSIYGKFISEKKRFKKLVKTKYKESKECLLQQIVTCEKTNPKHFWDLLKKLRGTKNSKTNKSPINTDVWTSYFKQLHNPKESHSANKDQFEIRVLEKLKMRLEDNRYDHILDSKFDKNEILNDIHKYHVQN